MNNNKGVTKSIRYEIKAGLGFTLMMVLICIVYNNCHLI